MSLIRSLVHRIKINSELYENVRRQAFVEHYLKTNGIERFNQLPDQVRAHFYDRAAAKHGPAWWKAGGRVKREIVTTLYLDHKQALGPAACEAIWRSIRRVDTPTNHRRS